MMLIKGSYDPNRAKHWTALPTGLVLFGGAGRADLRDAVLISCGNAPTCSGDDAGFSFTAGFDVWIKRWVAGTASTQPPRVTRKATAVITHSTARWSQTCSSLAADWGSRLGQSE
jgi:hypothetical protein